MIISREEFVKFINEQIEMTPLPEKINGNVIEVSWKDKSDYKVNAYGERTEPQFRHGTITIEY